MSDVWYYSSHGTTQGPVDTHTLLRMAWAGRIRPQHSVWKAGMADWAPAGKMPELFVQPVEEIPPLPPVGPDGEVSAIAPVGLTTYGDEYSEGFVWRDEDTLVILRGAWLPLRCARTNEPVEELVQRKLTLHGWAWALFLVGAFLGGGVLLTDEHENATIMIGLSKASIRRRRTAIAVGWLGALAGIVLVIMGFVAKSGGLKLLGLLVFPVTLLYACFWSRTVSASRINDHCVFLKGCCDAYLDAFPLLPPVPTWS